MPPSRLDAVATRRRDLERLFERVHQHFLDADEPLSVSAGCICLCNNGVNRPVRTGRIDGPLTAASEEPGSAD